MSAGDEEDVLIPEVLPPEPGFGGEPPRPHAAAPAIKPIVAGIVIDALDFITFGLPGLLLGFAVTFWMLGPYRLPAWQRLLWSFAAGWYCAIPFTRFIPLGTLVGAYVQFGRRK